MDMDYSGEPIGLTLFENHVPDGVDRVAADATEALRLLTASGCDASALVRVYLKLGDVPFRESRATGTACPEAIRTNHEEATAPILATGDAGAISSLPAILGHVEAAYPTCKALLPRDPKLRLIAHCIELYAMHGLTRPALYFRWHFAKADPQHLAEIVYGREQPYRDPDKSNQMVEEAARRTRTALETLGVTQALRRQFEDCFAQFVLLLEQHLSRFPFLLGGRPTIADAALYAIMSAHLANDPVPRRLLEMSTSNILPWIRRMETVRVSGSEGSDSVLLSSAALPGSLLSILRFIARDYLAEYRASVAWANLRDHAITDRPVLFPWRHSEIKTEVSARFFTFAERLQRAVALLEDADLAATLKPVGLQDLVENRLLTNLSLPRPSAESLPNLV